MPFGIGLMGVEIIKAKENYVAFSNTKSTYLESYTIRHRRGSPWHRLISTCTYLKSCVGT